MNRVLALLAALTLWSGLAGAQDFALSTNLADYANLGTLNLSADYALAKHWTIGAGVKYNPYTYRQQSYDVNARYWFWHSYSGWWIGSEARYQEYNSGGYSKGRYDSLEQTSEGDRYGGGLYAGYSLMLSTPLNLDF